LSFIIIWAVCLFDLLLPLVPDIETSETETNEVSDGEMCLLYEN